jgi:hypothetical protein
LLKEMQKNDYIIDIEWFNIFKKYKCFCLKNDKWIKF